MLEVGTDPSESASELPVSQTLTATFCERCGTRQEFRAPSGLGPLRKTRGFIGGLRTYIGGSDALSEAMREGMQAQESVVAAAQLDAFHASIHLCIDCRQYTCNDCWNVQAGRCRTCAPVVGVDDLADRIAASLATPASDASEPTAVPVFEHPVATPLAAEAWPQADHEVYPVAGLNGQAASPALEDARMEYLPALVEVEAELEAELEPEPVLAAEQIDETPPEAAAERPPLRVMAWDPDETGPEAAATVDLPDEEPLIAALDDVERTEPPAAEFEPTPIAAALEEEPEAALEPEPPAEPAPADAPEPQPMPAIQQPTYTAPRRSGPMRDRIVRGPRSVPRAAPPAPPAIRVAAQADAHDVAARRAQLELLGLDDASQSDAPASTDESGVLPHQSRGATVSNREATAAAIRQGLWEASARELDGAGVTVHSCGGCGLALSANARFCRRCGERQAQSA